MFLSQNADGQCLLARILQEVPQSFKCLIIGFFLPGTHEYVCVKTFTHSPFESVAAANIGQKHLLSFKKNKQIKSQTKCDPQWTKPENKL